jgi:2-polyprenyl-3-methyl-5-hydroxy-6-metoxy-1,4-benzoquinol methylase
MKGIWNHFHVWGRSRLCPFRAIASFVPEQGRIVDLGCGHGLFSHYLKTTSARREIQGYDLDEEKVRFAQAQFAREGLEFRVFNLLTQDLEVKADCIVIVDVLYLIPFERQTTILRRCREQLDDHGILVVKEVGDTPKWKDMINRFEETLAVKVFGITKGHDFYFHKSEEFCELLRQEGFSVEVHRVDRGYPHAHVAYICRKASKEKP